MIRTLRTLLLSTAALGALATAAAAAPPTPPAFDAAVPGMTGMHATGTPPMHSSTEGMTGMHTAMPTHPGVHDTMLDNPTTQAHMADYGVDSDQKRQWHETGTSVAQMHEALAEQGIDIDAMQADCPMLTDASMAEMHRSGGHHDTPGGDRS